jgi:hypothetical protein
LEYLLIEKIHPELFEYYTFTFYKYSDEYISYYSNINLVNALTEHEQVYAFHHYLKPATKYYYIGHSRSVKVVVELVRKNFESNGIKILQSFIQYVRENKPELYFFYFLSTLFLISIVDEYEIVDKKHIVRLKIFPTSCLRPSAVKAQKIEIISIDPVSIVRITEIICTKNIQALYVITRNKHKNRRAIETIKTILVNNFIEVSDYKIINGPYQHIDFNLNNKNCFLIFEDSQSFFGRISYKNNIGILIKLK